MNSSLSKQKASRYLRVSTVFTGAAAAVMGFTPAAHAQPAHAQPTVHHRAGTRVRPYGEVTACDGHSTWFHAYSTYTIFGITQHEAICVGFSSPTPVGNFNASGFCGGNNSGSFLGENNVWHPFHHGTTVYWFKPPKFPGSRYPIKSVEIVGWSGGDKCPS